VRPPPGIPTHPPASCILFREFLVSPPFAIKPAGVDFLRHREPLKIVLETSSLHRISSTNTFKKNKPNSISVCNNNFGSVYKSSSSSPFSSFNFGYAYLWWVWLISSQHFPLSTSFLKFSFAFFFLSQSRVWTPETINRSSFVLLES
jgi:hypothetical protein